MRNPKRIPKIMNRLQKIWERVPDWRLGQLLFNLLSRYGKDPFYVEDEKFITELEKTMDVMLGGKE